MKQLSVFWKEDIDTIVGAKAEDEEKYQAGVRTLFSSEGLPPETTK